MNNKNMTRVLRSALAIGLASGLHAASAQNLSREVAAAPPAVAANERWVSPTELFGVAAAALRPALESRGAKVELAPAEPHGKGIVVNARGAEIVARALPDGVPWGRRMVVWVDVRQAGVTLHSVMVPVSVQAVMPGWLASHDLPSGTRLTSSMLRQADVDVAGNGQAAWHGEPEGLVLRTPLMAGHYLVNGQAAAPYAVERGERVTLAHTLGAVEVVASALALQDGEVGQHVQVRADGAQGPVLGKVVAPGRVELQQ